MPIPKKVAFAVGCRERVSFVAHAVMESARVQASQDVAEVTTRDVALATVAPLRHVRDAFDRSVALVLGVNAYRHGIPQLKTAVPDAEAVGALLEAHHGFTTLLRCDAEVTSERVRSILQRGFRDELRGALTERDRLLIYFAGHGLSLPSEHGPEGQLLLADADPADPRSFLAMSELRQLIGALPCRHVLIVLDCCFAGTFRWAGKPGDREVSAPAYRETLERFVHHRAWQVLVSASHDQTAADAVSMCPPSGPLAPEVVDALGSTRIETAPNSPFAAALLRGLQGEADFTNDKLIIAAELELFVRDVVERATHVDQTPQLYKLAEHDRGEFVFQVPGTTLDLDPAPALSIAACPYQGLRPYSALERGRFFGRTQVLQELVERVTARSFTAVVGPSGIGKSSLLAAGLSPALRAMDAWTVLEARPGTTPDDTLRDLVASSEGVTDPGGTLLARIASWMACHASGRLCLVVDQAEELETRSGADVRTRVLAELAQALDAHGDRLRVVLGLRSEVEPVFRASALGPLWGNESLVVPALTQDELREIIEQPARLQELSFEPPELVDSLINEVLQAPGGLPLLSFMLRELYLGCVERNRDRLLTQHDYLRMGRLSGALCRRANELVAVFVARDPAFAATARRVFLRMVVRSDGEYLRRRVPRDELVYADAAENARVEALLVAFQDARLVVLDKNAWEFAHDDLVRAWDALSTWRLAFGDPALELEHELAGAAGRWDGTKRSGALWHDDRRLRPALRAARDPDAWLSARERAFIAASERRRRLPSLAAFAMLALALATVLTLWELYDRPHVAYSVSYTRRWGEPEGLDRLSESEARLRRISFKLVRNGRLGHVSHMERVRDGERLTLTSLANFAEAGGSIESAVAHNGGPKWLACQWDFEYEAGTGTVSTETAKDSSGQILYKLHYRSGPRERRIAELLRADGFNASIGRGDIEVVEFVRSPQGFDEEWRYFSRNGQPARSGKGVSIDKYRSDDQGHLIQASSLDVSGKPMRIFGMAGARLSWDDRGNPTTVMFIDEVGAPLQSKHLGIAGWHARFDDRGNVTEKTWVDEAGQPMRGKDGVTSWRSTYDDRGNEILRMSFDEAGKPVWRKDEGAGTRFTYDERGNQIEAALVDELSRPTQNASGVAGSRRKYDDRGNQIERVFFDGAGRPVRDSRGVAGFRAKFDERDNEVEHVFIDEAGRPIRDKQGIAGFRAKFDLQRNEIEHVFVDETGKPIRNREGYAGIRSRFDDHGNLTEQTSVDEAGRTIGVGRNDGIAGWRAKFDERGNEIERVSVDEASQPTPFHNGVAGVRSKFDGRGNEIEHMFLGKGGTPTRRDDGLAGWRSRFDGHGQEIEHAFVDEAGHLTRNKDGFAGWRSTLDARGNPIETVYFDEAGRPARNQEGVASCRASYDERGEKIERACFDEAGRPALTRDGYASWRATYDGRGNQTAIVYFDQAGQPLPRR